MKENKTKMLAVDIANALLNSSAEMICPSMMAELSQDIQELWQEAHKNEFTYRRVCQILDDYFMDLINSPD